MPGARDDYLLRLIQEAAAAVRKLRSRLGAGDSQEDVVRDADTAIGTLLGPQRGMLERLDAWSAANLIGDNDKLDAWIALLTVQADASVNPTEESRLRSRMTALRGHLKR